MKHLKLFEESMIEEKDFPYIGHDLSPRERKILTDSVGESYLSRFTIKVDDHYYYTKYNGWHGMYYNVFSEVWELKDYVLSSYFIYCGREEEYLELLKTSNLDPSFDDNYPIRWASVCGHIEIVEHLLSDPRVDPSYGSPIVLASNNGREEVVKILLSDERVRSNLTDLQINKYTNEISKIF